MTEAERRKLDPALVQLLSEEDGRLSPDRYDVMERPDGTPEFGVVITAEDPEALRGRFNIQSVFGQMATARLSRAELRELLRLDEVKYVQMGERSYPQTYEPDA